MVNTLFLAYAGISLPLILMFTLEAGNFSSPASLLSQEFIAIEIIRTLAGSIGLILAIPISSLIASYYFSKKQKS